MPMPFGDAFRRPRPELIGQQVPNQLPALPSQQPIFAAQRPRPTGEPMGAATGFQVGVDANPTNKAYEDFINSVGAEQRRKRVGGGVGERIWRSPGLERWNG